MALTPFQVDGKSVQIYPKINFYIVPLINTIINYFGFIFIIWVRSKCITTMTNNFH